MLPNAPMQHSWQQQALRTCMERLSSQLEPILLASLTQMASLAPPRPKQSDNLGRNYGKDVEKPMDGARASANIIGRNIPNVGFEQRQSLPSMSGAVTTMASTSTAEALQLQGLYPSDSTRLAFCLRVLQAWRCDPLAQQVQALVDGLGGSRGIAIPPGGIGVFSGGQGADVGGQWAGIVADGMFGAQGATQQSLNAMTVVLGLARVRAGALCTLLVHVCDMLLSLRLVGPSQACVAGDPGAALLSDSPHLQFDGGSVRFRQLLLIVEMALHLFCVNLGALVVAIDVTGAAAAAIPNTFTIGGPRLALVAQYLLLLRQFNEAVGGKVVPVGRHIATGVGARGGPPAEPADLTFAACLAQRAERLLAELQTL